MPCHPNAITRLPPNVVSSSFNGPGFAAATTASGRASAFFTSCFLWFARNRGLVFGQGRRPQREKITVQDRLAKAKAEEYSRYADEHERRAKTLADPVLRDALLNVANAISRSRRTGGGNKQAHIGRRDAKCPKRRRMNTALLLLVMLARAF